ncbi:MAG: DUF3783 domain-containing protein [Clostridiales bacterium]|nr:DUF3783 domain-containing protein [Clostridiales bacterium]
MAKQTLLLYDPEGVPWAGKLRQVCTIQGFRFRAVDRSDLDRTVGALAEGLKRAGEPEKCADVPETVIVFCGVGSAQLDRLLQALRKMGVPRNCLKAVLTAQNAKWPFHVLYEELVKERTALS